jgi:hypothetical protein
VPNAEGDGHASWVAGDCGAADGEGDVSLSGLPLELELKLWLTDAQLPSDTSTAWLHAITASRNFW